MTDLTTTRTSDWVNTQTPGVAAVGVRTVNLLPLARLLLQRRNAVQAQALAPAANIPPATFGDAQSGGVDSQLDYAQKRQKILEMQAAENGPPMREVSGPQIIPGKTMDVNAMNAIQRQLYLPQNSQQTTVGAQEDAMRSGAALDAEIQRRRLADQEQAAAMADAQRGAILRGF